MTTNPPKMCNFNFSDEPESSVSNRIASAEATVEKVDDNLDLVLDDNLDIVSDEESASPIKFERKKLIEKHDIFDIPKKKKKVLEEMPDNIGVMPDEVKDDLLQDTMESQVSYVPTVKVKKKRKPMTEEHKAKLGLAREKAVIARKAKAVLRAADKALDEEEKVLVKKQRVKRVQKLKEEIEDEPKEPKEASYAPTHMGQQGLSKKDLEEAQLDTLIKYEAMRKERKEKKKQEAMVNAEKNKMLKNIQRATGLYSYGDGSNRFDGCY